MPFNSEDLEHLKQRGIQSSEALRQLSFLKEGFRPLELAKAAKISEGIEKLISEKAQYFADVYQEKNSQYTVEKFVPASGAATRMFKLLYQLLEEESLDLPLSRAQFTTAEAQEFAQHFKNLAFYEQWNALGDLNQISSREALKTLLEDEFMAYGSKPKALLAFHRENDQVTNPLYTHLLEAQDYGQSRLHLTISSEHREAIEKEIDALKSKLQIEVECSYSYQMASTDTLAVDYDDELVRDIDHKLIFRPGGHGALLQNLNARNADLVFIKNIDNVCTLSSLEAHNFYKKVLGGYAIEIVQQLHHFQQQLENDETVLDRHGLNNFLQRYFGTYIDPEAKDFNAKAKEYVFRPLRVCGMVANEGQPGGGPFWVKLKGATSLQIVESAQIDQNSEEQLALMQSSTHFNPVDIVASLTDYKGRAYDLNDFIDHEQGFIAHKSFDGRPIKALELPGLWNGSMAYWNSCFVEVPAATFNPVKNVLDLLKPSHQGSNVG